MNSKRGLMTVLVGVAMLAMPLTAAAKDHGRFQNSQARNFTAPYVAPGFASRHEFRNGATWAPAPAGLVNRDEWRENHRGWNYGNRGYYPAPVYTAPVYAAPVYSGYGYGGGQGYGYGGGQGCGQAQHVMRTYQRDRATGHPAAAADVLRQNQWALRGGCAGGLGGYGGYGNNYGGYNGGYRNGGYRNGGYGQPYGNGSMLAPLLQYVR
jgi:hypothetical protein